MHEDQIHRWSGQRIELGVPGVNPVQVVRRAVAGPHEQQQIRLAGHVERTWLPVIDDGDVDACSVQLSDERADVWRLRHNIDGDRADLGGPTFRLLEGEASGEGAGHARRQCR